MQLDGRFIKIAHDPGDPQLCSHCPFCGSGQITGRSDGGIDCSFCGMNFIVRVQPAFPGMPQAPGMGAPTDIGPDGMPVDPMMGGMEDPGMMPPGEGDEGMPPGMEDGDDEGAPPFGDDGGGDEGAPEEDGPPVDDQGGSVEGPPPPPSKDKDSKSDKKGKSKKKGSLRLYRTLSGEQLDERRYVRHLAVLHSSADPRVLAMLRAEAS
jgi:hypothetical protein